MSTCPVRELFVQVILFTKNRIMRGHINVEIEEVDQTKLQKKWNESNPDYIFTKGMFCKHT